MEKWIIASVAGLMLMVAGMGLYNHLHKPVEGKAPDKIIVKYESKGINVIRVPVALDSGNISRAKRFDSQLITESLNRQERLAMRLKMADTPTCTPGEGDPAAGPGYLCGTWIKRGEGPWEWVR